MKITKDEGKIVTGMMFVLKKGLHCKDLLKWYKNDKNNGLLEVHSINSEKNTILAKDYPHDIDLEHVDFIGYEKAFINYIKKTILSIPVEDEFSRGAYEAGDNIKSFFIRSNHDIEKTKEFIKHLIRITDIEYKNKLEKRNFNESFIYTLEKLLSFLKSIDDFDTLKIFLLNWEEDITNI
ncbi:hypothetical protein BFS06_14305 [Clostridium perfringens]|uniref:Uncharacterized protein n=1 Tax=Clostridium perfringens TaxID=1502 RepID=A0A140GRF2_CLOPF|nr:hypothetical protein [Clostridium perfringens]AMN31111.1 hypothetical protein JFP838_pA0195 [Clostridium perfringens]TBX14378.1 hypothetical protein BFS06_14305 [Clostridium perfringens]